MRRLALLALIFSAFGYSQARVWQDSFVWPTFVEGPADVNPPFDQFRAVSRLPNIYPYTSRTNFTTTKRDQSWRAIYLENEYLKCSILPDVGGHVYSCLDKIANREMFYANRSFRKNDVALRGSWAAFGLELNFPIGHSWVSVSPVDFAFRNNADGSASAWVGNVDRVTGMQWRVEFVLHPGRAVLEQRVTLENRSDVRHAYYWWSNAAVRLESAQDQFILPTNLTSIHGSGEIDTWPRNVKGQRLDTIGNYTDAAGLFAVGSREEFMGAYLPGKRAGLVHVAKLDEVPGKKTWTWGPDTWPNENLSDDNSTYIEIQAGVMPSQENHDFLNPQERKTFTEYWIPARNLGGISRANGNAIAYVGRTANRVVTELNVTRFFPNAVVEIRNAADELVFRETIDLRPESGWNKQLPVFAAPAKLRVLDETGTEIFAHTEGKIDAAQPGEIAVGKVPAPTWLTAPKTAADYIERATSYEREEKLDAALADYDSALALDAGSIDARKQRGRLLAKLGQWIEASAMLSVPDGRGDLEARYYAALAAKDARKMESLVGSTSPFSAAAAIKAAEWRAAANDLEGALPLARKAGASLIRAGAVEVAILRGLERWEEARTRLDEWLAIDPTDLLLRYEDYRLGADSETFWRHLGSDAERVLNVAEHLMRLGQFTDALEVLEAGYPAVPENEMEQDMPAPARHPLVWLYRAYCRQRAGLPFQTELEAAATLPLRYIFPNRVAALEILQGAWMGRVPDANQRYLYGLLLLSMRRTDDAIAALDPLRRERPQLPALHRTLGRIWLDVKGNKARALPILQEGVQYEPDNQDLWRAIDRAR